MPRLPVIVLGSGLGGLAAAIRLRAMGWPGRSARGHGPARRARGVFLQDGFSFDAGPTVVTASYLFDELFALVGRDRRDHLEFMPVDPFYRVFFPDGGSFDYVGDEERLLAQIRALTPRDVDGYRQARATTPGGSSTSATPSWSTAPSIASPTW
jgi:phytoene desaturase